MIPEPQRTYVLELMAALGTAADDFVVAGAQAMKFTVEKARGTKDVDFILNVIALREEPLQLAEVFESLGYKPVPESRNFQFVKPIPNSSETMRIEFMAPEEFKRHNDIRVDIQDGVHARACTGGSIAITQSDRHTISGNLPNGTPFTGQIRVTRPHALVMLKLLALADRYNNLRGPKEARHDREEAQTHASDIVAILAALPDLPAFNTQFIGQFQQDPILSIHVLSILLNFFRDIASPGLLVYSEHVAANLPQDRATPAVVRAETEVAQKLVARIIPPPEFFAVAAAINDSTNHSQGGPIVDEYLSNLENARMPINDPLALQSLPAAAFSGAYSPGATFVMSASELIAKLSQTQRELLHAYLQSKLSALRTDESLRKKYPHTLKH
ncbi:MAG: nucleotidyl transferase AbiEii/AbiGii toxin family protein [Candidatus Acidiferrum sp.]